ncbi:MAG: RNA polymerase sigma factor [Vicinamibacteraceae bacterium]
MAASTTDGELVQAARSGAEDARDELVRRYQRQAILLAATLVNDPAEGEDLAREAFVRAFRNLDLLADPSRFGAWLRRIVFGVSIDWLRSFRPDLYRGWDAIEEPLEAHDPPSPLDQLLRGEMTTRVAAALTSLPPRYRVPLRLFHIDGLSHSKIAGAHGVPVGTVRSLVARARRKLVPLLADYAPDTTCDVDDLFKEQQAMPSSATRFLHVANGTATTDKFQEAGIPGTSSIWADVLHEGPVPGGVSDEALLEIRARHLADEIEHPYQDTLEGLRRWRTLVDGHAAYDELVLWYEHDLFDQLNLIQLLCRIGQTVLGAKPVSLICIGAFPGRPQFKGLGDLTPDELASLLESRRPVTATECALAERAWHAFRAHDPRALEAFAREETPALPFLSTALHRHLQEFPWTVDGLSRTERRLMTLAQSEPIDVWAAFPRMHEGETAFYIADGSFWQVVQDLTLASPPLVAVHGITDIEPHRLPRGTIELTDTGRAVLAGEIDRVARCGLDRWLGGVHLQGTGPTWRWDSAERHIVWR